MGLFDKMFPPQQTAGGKQKKTAKKAEPKKTVKKENTVKKPKTENKNKAEAKQVVKKTVKTAKPDATKPAVKKPKTEVPAAAKPKTKAPAAAKASAPAEEPKKRRTPPGRFEIKHTKDGRFVFNLYASNGEIIATSQSYTSATAAMAGANSVIANASLAGIEDQTLSTVQVIPFPKWEIYLDKSGEYRFRLNATNGYTVCHSQGYTSKASCRKGIESVRRTVLTAKLAKAYLEEE